MAVCRRAEPQPSIQIFPKKVIIGENVSLTCSLKHTCSTDYPLMKWNLTGDLTFRSQTLKDGEVNVSTVLTYTPSYTDDGRRLQCSYSLSPGRTKSKFEILAVLYPPKMVIVNSSHENGEVRRRDDVTLTCSGTANPPVTTYKWYKGDRLLVNSSDSVLEIKDISAKNSGSYRCEAYNDVGESSSLPVFLLCVDCRPLFPVIMGAASGVILLILAVAAMTVVLVILKKRKQVNPSPHHTQIEDVTTTNVYMNLQFADNAVSLENPYTALQDHNRSPDYDEIKRGTSPESPGSQTQPDYEEVLSYRVIAPR
uniref:Ig-like domain-containing protein n=1 Tax=Leptobrachium leishanense TaxID=445787 RepID=A0A8C5QKI0_9ANUR